MNFLDFVHMFFYHIRTLKMQKTRQEFLKLKIFHQNVRVNILITMPQRVKQGKKNVSNGKSYV